MEDTEETDEEDEEKKEEKKKKKKKKKPPKELFKNVKIEKAYFFLTKKNIVRRICGWFVEHKYFETLILTMIVLNSIKLAYDTYLPENPATESEKNL